MYSSEKPRTSVLQIKNDFSETGDICLGLLCYAYGTLKLTLSDSNRVLSAVNNTKVSIILQPRPIELEYTHVYDYISLKPLG